MPGLGTDPEFRMSGVERLLLRVLKVPEAPSPPDESPESVRVFRAGWNYYVWSLIMWSCGALAAGGAMLGVSLPLAVAIRQGPRWAQVAAAAALVLIWFVYLTTAGVTLVSRRLNYGLRWYIVTDRSLRIRSGIIAIKELTMTYSNVQEIRVASGPLQLLLGIADVEVQAAGGGGDGKQGAGGHAGRFSGVAHAADIRDLIVERLRQYRDSGLGETAPVAALQPASELAAARAVLGEARALRAALDAVAES
jgi:membrane protein YdbS with pleckstrin-like domain